MGCFGIRYEYDDVIETETAFQREYERREDFGWTPSAETKERYEESLRELDKALQRRAAETCDSY